MNKLEELLNLESVNIEGKSYDFDIIREAADIDSTNLEEEFAKHPKLVMITGFAYEKAVSFAEALEIQLKRTYAIVDARVREELAVSSAKATEKLVESKVITDPDYVQIQDALLSAQAQAGLLKAAKDSMQHRRDALVALASNERLQRQADLYIKG